MMFFSLLFFCFPLFFFFLLLRVDYSLRIHQENAFLAHLVLLVRIHYFAGKVEQEQKNSLFLFSLSRNKTKKNQKNHFKKKKKTGRLHDPCGLRPLPERLEPPPRPGEVEGRRRLCPGEVRPRRRRRRRERRGGVPSERQQQRFCRRRSRRSRFVFFLCRSQRDHRVVLVPALWGRKAQVHRGPVCALRERDGAGDLCAEGKFWSFLKARRFVFFFKDEKTHPFFLQKTNNNSLTLRSPRGLRPCA